MISSNNRTVNSNLGCNKNIVVTENSSICKEVLIDDKENDKRPDIFSSKVYELHQLIELLQSTDSVTQENIVKNIHANYHIPNSWHVYS